MQEGTYPVRKVNKYWIQNTRTGSVALNLQLTVGDGENVKYTGWIKCKTPEATKKTLPRLVEDLLNLGYTEETLEPLAEGNRDAVELFNADDIKDVEAVVSEESFENDKGETINFFKVKWLNKFTIKSMDAGEAIEVINSGNANNLLAEAIAKRDGGKVKDDDDDVPF